MTNLTTNFSELKLATNAQISVALDLLKETGQSKAVAYVDLAQTKVENAWKCVDELLVTVTKAEQRTSEAENKLQSLETVIISLEDKNEGLESQISKLEDELSLLRASNTQLSEELTEVKQSLQTVTTERNQEQGKAANLQGKINKFAEVEKELADLKALNPLQLKSERDQAVTKFNKEKTSHINTKTKLNIRISDLEHEVSALNGKLVSLAGQKQHKSIMGTDKKTRFHVREYQGSNELRLEFDPALGTVNDLDWHIKVESGNGICLHVGVSDFFTPLMPYSTEIDALYPVELNDYLHKYLMVKLKDSHPRHIKMINAAKEEILTTKKELFTETEIKWLQKAKFITLFDACSLTFGTFGTKIKTAAGKSYDCALMNDLYKKVQAIALLLKRDHKF